MAEYPSLDSPIVQKRGMRPVAPGRDAAGYPTGVSTAPIAEAYQAVARPVSTYISSVAANNADSLIAGSQGRVDAARTAAMSDYQKYGQMKDSRDFADTPNAPSKSNEAYPGMEATIAKRLADGRAPSAAEEAAAQAAQAAEIQRRRQGMQNEWLMRQGISPEALQQPKLGWNRDPNTPAPGPGMREYDYSGFAAPGTRIFAGRDNKGQLSITGAGLPSMESVGGSSGSHTQKVGATLAQMSEKLAGMSGATDVRSMMERKSLRRSIAELSGVHNTLAGYEHGMATVGETTRGKKQSERAVSAQQGAALIPHTLQELVKLNAMQDPDTYRNFMAAGGGGFPRVYAPAASPLGNLFAPGQLPQYYNPFQTGLE